MVVFILWNFYEILEIPFQKDRSLHPLFLPLIELKESAHIFIIRTDKPLTHEIGLHNRVGADVGD